MLQFWALSAAISMTISWLAKRRMSDCETGKVSLFRDAVQNVKAQAATAEYDARNNKLSSPE